VIFGGSWFQKMMPPKRTARHVGLIAVVAGIIAILTISVWLLWPVWNYHRAVTVLRADESDSRKRIQNRAIDPPAAQTPEEDIFSDKNAKPFIMAAAQAVAPRDGTFSEVPTFGVTDIVISHDGRLAVTAGGFGGGIIKLWSLPGLMELNTFQVHKAIGVTNRAYSPKLSKDDRYVACGCSDATVYVWDAKTGTEKLRVRGHSAEVEHLFFLADGAGALSIDRKGTAIVWNVEDGRESQRTVVVSSPVKEWGTRASLSPDGARLIVYDSSKPGKRLGLYELESGARLPRFMTREVGSGSGARALAFSPDSSQVLVGTYENQIELRNSDAGDLVWKTTRHEGEIRIVAFSGDGKHTLSADDRSFRVWDSSNGDEIARFKTGAIISAACTPDGQFVLLGTNLGRILYFRIPRQVP
jgi:WD40 repeat protein